MPPGKILHDTGEPEEPEDLIEVDRATVKNDRMQAVSDYADAVLGEDISFQEFAEWKLAKTRKQQPVQANSGGNTLEELIRQQQAIIDGIDPATADPQEQKARRHAQSMIGLLSRATEPKTHREVKKRIARQPNEYLDRQKLLKELERFG